MTASDKIRQRRRRTVIVIVALVGVGAVSSLVAWAVDDAMRAYEVLGVWALCIWAAFTSAFPEPAYRVHRRWLPAALVVVFMAAAIITGDRKADPSFYVVSAELIPILVLALAVQGTVLKNPGPPRGYADVRRKPSSFDVVHAFRGATVLTAMALLAVGEGSALWAVFFAAPVYAGGIVGAICAGFVGVFAMGFVGYGGEAASAVLRQSATRPSAKRKPPTILKRRRHRTTSTLQLGLLEKSQVQDRRGDSVRLP